MSAAAHSTERVPVRQHAALKERLDQLVETFDASTISPDPLELVLRFDGAEDQEVVGLLAAAFAYGRADIVVRNVGWIVDRMTPSPAEFLRRFDRRRHGTRFRGFSHRFQKTPELLDLLHGISQVLRHHGSLHRLFLAGDNGLGDIAEPLTRFVTAITDVRALPARRRRALAYLLPSPAAGSACKRMNLYLRWMIRSTPPDPGTWQGIDQSRLVIPLDTHIHRITSFLGLNDRQTVDWTTARRITDRLLAFDAQDPVRYDFAICRLGILDLCSRTRRKENCHVCLLRDVCHFPLS